MRLVLPGRGEPQPNSVCQLTVSRAARPCAPEAQHAPRAHSTESKVPASNSRQLIPPSSLTSLPDGPTATTVRSVPGRNAEPDRYPPGACPAGTSDQVPPPSVLRNTRGRSPPPVANHAVRPGPVTRQVPLAANANSPGSAAGVPAFGTTSQERPPSPVARIRNFPPTGSLSASPRFASKKS